MIVQMNGPHPSSNFSFCYFRPSVLPQTLQLYIPESITLLKCQYNVFLPCVAIIIAAFLKRLQL